MPSKDEFPSLGQQSFAGQAPQQQIQDQSSQPGMSAGANPFSMSASTSKAFIPEGMVGYTDDFPGLGDNFSQPMGKKAKKPKGPTKQELEEKKRAEQEATATKGKEPSFFVVDGAPNTEQMMFVYQYYPQYSYNPGDIITWCYHEATRLLQMEKLASEANNDAYGKNTRGNTGGFNNND